MSKDDGLSEAELLAEDAAPLPDREAMSAIHGRGLGALADGLADNFAMPINEATAVNVESTSSYAIADADQIVIIEQVDDDQPEG